MKKKSKLQFLFVKIIIQENLPLRSIQKKQKEKFENFGNNLE